MSKSQHIQAVLLKSSGLLTPIADSVMERPGNVLNHNVLDRFMKPDRSDFLDPGTAYTPSDGRQVAQTFGQSMTAFPNEYLAGENGPIRNTANWAAMLPEMGARLLTTSLGGLAAGVGEKFKRPGQSFKDSLAPYWNASNTPDVQETAKNFYERWMPKPDTDHPASKLFQTFANIPIQAGANLAKLYSTYKARNS